MEDLKDKTLIELQRMSSEIEMRHEYLKADIVEKTNELDLLEKEINDMLKKLDIFEKEYISIIDELNSRNAI
jgi:alpha-N-acetylglucosamine transferase